MDKDKQIIIDGCNVSGCLYYSDRDGYCEACKDDIDGYSFTKCSSEDNCYYKQLKRAEQTVEECHKYQAELEDKLEAKEQEYEELQQYHNKCCEENAKKEAEWLEKYNQVSRDFYNGKYCNKENCSLLKAKEQECEELKNIINEAKNSKLDLKSFLVGEAVQNEYEQQLDQLKAELTRANCQIADDEILECDMREAIEKLTAENDELKHQHQADKGLITATGKMNYELLQEYDKLKTALTEIKEIAEAESYLSPQSTRLLVHKILQKISEVENEHNG